MGGTFTERKANFDKAACSLNLKDGARLFIASVFQVAGIQRRRTFRAHAVTYLAIHLSDAGFRSHAGFTPGTNNLKFSEAEHC